MLMTIIRFAGFIALSLGILFGLHYLLYASIIRFFVITEPGVRKVIMWLLSFFALSFLPSAVLLRLHVNVATKLLYMIASIWLGLFLYLLMALVLIWFVFGVGKIVGVTPDMRSVCLLFFLLAAAVSAYGMWRARHPIFKQLEVKIDGLPNHWQNRTVVQLSDLHLGVINGTGFMEKVAAKVNSLNPDLILLTGDVFDGMGSDLPVFIEPLKRLKASRGIFFITGNHEVYLGLERPLAVIRETGIRILDMEIVDLDGLQIVGIPFPVYNRKYDVRHLLKQSGAFDPAKPSILLYHTPTDIGEQNMDRQSQQSRTYWFPDTSMSLAKEVGIDLQLSGHTHKGQLFPFGSLAHRIYKGYDYGLHRDGKFQIYISSGVGTWGPPMRTAGSSEIVVITLH